METYTITAETRPAGTKGDARKIRKAGATPAVVYRAGEPAKVVQFDGPSLTAIFRKTNDANTLITIKMPESEAVCLVREVQRHPLTRRIEHVDFIEVKKGEKVTVTVPITTSGRAAGVRAGGMLRVLSRSVVLEGDAYALPKSVDVDVTALGIGRFVRASELSAPNGAVIRYRQDFNIVTVEGKRTAETPAADAAPAAGAKAAPGKAAAPAAAKAPAKK